MKSGNTTATLCLYLVCFFQGLSQENKIKKSDSCIVSMNIFNYKRVDSLNCYVEKKALPGFIEHIKECQNNYTYPQDYRDTGFVIQIPVYLKNRYYTFGDENFSISFYDTTDEDQHTVRSISIYYDFDSSYREFVLKELAAGKR